MSIVDLAVREAALDISRSFAVSAPAGSGKTGLLIRRLLRLLAASDQPEEVLAITFTRKAAAEMRERIIDALARAQQDNPPQEEYERAIWQDARTLLARDRANNWQLLSSPNRLRILTIDSLCRNLARQMATETGMGDLPEPTEDATPVYRDAVRNLFLELEKPGQVGDDLANLLEHLDNNLATLESLLVSLMSRREQWLEALLISRGRRQALENTLRDTVAETLELAGSHLAPFLSEILSLADYAAANLAKNQQSSPICRLSGATELRNNSVNHEHLEQWLGLCELVLTKDDQWRKPAGLNKKLGFPSAPKDCAFPDIAKERKQQFGTLLEELTQHETIRLALTDIRHLPGIGFNERQWHILESLTRLLPLLVAELSLLFRTRQSCDFTEITLAALEALGDDSAPTDLGLKLDYQIQHILVDEFQDTSSVQFALLKKLTSGWTQNDGRSLFIVGDGMQSLYGFRSANVGLFLEARKHPIGDISLTPLNLETNFRSDDLIVSWVNHIFGHVFPSQEDVSRGAVPYSAAIASKQNMANAEVTIDIFTENSHQDREAATVIERVQNARQKDPTGSIAILVRARSHLSAVMTQLQAAGIPWLASDMDSLSSRMPVIDLLSLTKALLNPADRIAWLAMLRAPFCGLTLNDLHVVANFGGDWDGNPRAMSWLPGQLFKDGLEADLSADGRQRFQRILPLLKMTFSAAYRKPLRQWVEGLWLALGGPATLSTEEEIGWCEQYFTLLEQHAVGSELPDMVRFETAVTRLFAKPQTSAENPVHLMTIHKSKGLEFDTVILPALHRGGGTHQSSLLYWRQRINKSGETQLLISPPVAIDISNNDSSPLVNHLKHEEKIKNVLEDARVIYVACTRAIKRLHLIYQEPSTVRQGSLLASLWPAFGKEDYGSATVVRHNDQPASALQQEPQPRITSLLRIPAHWQHPCSLDTSPQQDSATSNPLQLDSSSEVESRCLGDVLHRTLCQIVLEGLELWDQDRINRQQAAWTLQLRQLGTNDIDGNLTLLRVALKNMLNDKKGRWLLSRHSQDGCEQALGYLGDKGPAKAVIDRTFVYEGIRWIVDYKSATPHPGEAMDAFLAREEKMHSEQLAGYRDLLLQRGPEPVRLALYFPLIPAFHELQ